MVRYSRGVYLVFVWLFIIGVLVQVFLAGMVVVSRQLGWIPHTTLGHLLSFPLVVMLVTMYLGQLPGPMKRLTWLLFVVYLLQADVLIFMRDSVPLLAVPSCRSGDFWLGVTSIRETGSEPQLTFNRRHNRSTAMLITSVMPSIAYSSVVRHRCLRLERLIDCLQIPGGDSAAPDLVGRFP